MVPRGSARASKKETERNKTFLSGATAQAKQESLNVHNVQEERGLERSQKVGCEKEDRLTGGKEGATSM